MGGDGVGVGVGHGTCGHSLSLTLGHVDTKKPTSRTRAKLLGKSKPFCSLTRSLPRSCRGATDSRAMQLVTRGRWRALNMAQT